MSAMGERFLILEETADALDVIDPELAVHFRTVNGLPRMPRDAMYADPEVLPLEAAAATKHHEIRMDVGDDRIRSDCSCGAWSSTVDWDEIDVMVTEVREHVGSARESGADVTVTTESPTGPDSTAERVG